MGIVAARLRKTFQAGMKQQDAGEDGRRAIVMLNANEPAAKRAILTLM
jgi:hypothetical protein